MVRICFLPILVLICFLAGNECRYIYTFCGNGQANYTGDGKPAIDASIDFPMGIAVSPSGSVYIADSYNNVIRKVSVDGIINTFAGNGANGYSGDGSYAVDASLSYPQGVAVSPSGSVYIADSYNNVIRKVSVDGIINTFAGTGVSGYDGDGGSALNAELNAPAAIAVSFIGDVFIADSGNNRIRVVFTNGTIASIAVNGNTSFEGNGVSAINATINYPQGIAISLCGVIYIADTQNNYIRALVCNPGRSGYNCQVDICHGQSQNFSSSSQSSMPTIQAQQSLICGTFQVNSTSYVQQQIGTDNICI
jgi:hypothetical protein